VVRLGEKEEGRERERERTDEMSSSLFFVSHFFQMLLLDDSDFVMKRFESYGGMEIREIERERVPAHFRGGRMNFHQTFVTYFNEIHDIFSPKNDPSLVIKRIEFGVIVRLPYLCLVVERKDARESTMSLSKRGVGGAEEGL
jgi:hypothetical protein